MSSRRILCNLDDSAEMELWEKIGLSCLKSSSYNLVLGVPSSIFYDFDEVILGRAEDKEYDYNEGRKIALNAVDKIIEKIKIIEVDSGIRFDKMAIIDKGGVGPVGMIGLMPTALAKAKRKLIVIRPKKRLFSASIKGELKRDENVLIISDVATSGTTIYLAAQKIWHFGGKVPNALVWMNRDVGANENLKQYGITLFGIVDPRTLASRSKKLEKELRSERHERYCIDFGATSMTSVSSNII